MKRQPINFKALFSFNLERFIQQLMEFECYFKNRVKVINYVSYEDPLDMLSYEFYVDIPSINFSLVAECSLSKNNEECSISIKSDFFEVYYLPLTESQYLLIDEICRRIYLESKKKKEKEE